MPHVVLHKPLWDCNILILVPILRVRGDRKESETKGGYGNADEDKGIARKGGSELDGA